MKTKIKRISKRTLSMVLSLMMVLSTVMVGGSFTADAATETTIYFAENGSDGISSYFNSDGSLKTGCALKLNVNRQGDGDSWATYIMSEVAGETYQGKTIYSCTFTDLYNGLGKMQIQAFQNDVWQTQLTPISSWTVASNYNGKIYYNDAWETATWDPPVAESITLTPNAEDVYTNSTITLTAAAISPVAGATYSYKVNGEAILGASGTSATYQPADTGTYTFTVTASKDGYSSKEATCTVNARKLEITKASTNYFVIDGEVTLSTNVFAGDTVSYTVTDKNGDIVPLTGTDNNKFTPTMAGEYTVRGEVTKAGDGGTINLETEVVIFTETPKYTLDVDYNPTEGSVVITVSDSDGSNPTTYSAGESSVELMPGQKVQLQANASTTAGTYNKGYKFSKWETESGAFFDNMTGPYTSKTITFYPTGNVAFTAVFDEDIGKATSDYYLYYIVTPSDNPRPSEFKDKLTFYEYEEGHYRADITSIINSNEKVRFIASSSSSSLESGWDEYLNGKQNAVCAMDGTTTSSYISSIKYGNDWSGYRCVNVDANPDAYEYITKAYIVYHKGTDHSKYTIYAEGNTISDAYTVYAKNGTIGAGGSGSSKWGETEAVFTTASDKVRSKNYIDYTEYKIKKDAQVKFRTKVTKSDYAVYDFVINGKKYDVEEVTHGGQQYYQTVEAVTVTEDLEVTPVYYDTRLEYITIYVDADSLGDHWGNTVSVFTWYKDGKLMDGAYPGQPLGRDSSGFYVGKVARYSGATGSSTNIISGLTLNNYYENDSVHQKFLTEDEQKHNLQTYDYDDFIKLVEMGVQTVRFDTHYYSNGTNQSQYAGKTYTLDSKAKPTKNADNVTLNQNDYIPLTNFLQEQVGVTGLADRNVISATSLSGLQYKANGDYAIKVISVGNMNTSMGEWSTIWYVYDVSGSTPEFITSGLPSDFIPRGSYDGSGNFVYSSTQTAAYQALEEYTISDISAKYYAAEISYESEQNAESSTSSKNTGIRSDGRWAYILDVNNVNIDVGIAFGEKTEDGWTEDTVVSDTRTGNTTGATVGVSYETNPKALEYKNIPLNTTMNIEATQGAKGYTFVGWYKKTVTGTGDDAVTTYKKLTSFTKLSGTYTLSMDTSLVAMYIPDAGSITATHDIYNKATIQADVDPAAHNGSGKTYVKVEIIDTDNSDAVVYSNGNIDGAPDTRTTSAKIDSSNDTIKDIIAKLNGATSEAPAPNYVVKYYISSVADTGSEIVTMYRKDYTNTNSSTSSSYIVYTDDTSKGWTVSGETIAADKLTAQATYSTNLNNLYDTENSEFSYNAFNFYTDFKNLLKVYVKTAYYTGSTELDPDALVKTGDGVNVTEDSIIDIDLKAEITGAINTATFGDLTNRELSNLKQGDQITLNAGSEKTTGEGGKKYRFIGWYVEGTDSNAGKFISADANITDNKYTLGDEDLTIYAIYIEQVDVKVQTQCGSTILDDSTELANKINTCATANDVEAINGVSRVTVDKCSTVNLNAVNGNEYYKFSFWTSDPTTEIADSDETSSKKATFVAMNNTDVIAHYNMIDNVTARIVIQYKSKSESDWHTDVNPKKVANGYARASDYSFIPDEVGIVKGQDACFKWSTVDTTYKFVGLYTKTGDTYNKISSVADTATAYTQADVQNDLTVYARFENVKVNVQIAYKDSPTDEKWTLDTYTPDSADNYTGVHTNVKANYNGHRYTTLSPGNTLLYESLNSDEAGNKYTLVGWYQGGTVADNKYTAGTEVTGNINVNNDITIYALYVKLGSVTVNHKVYRNTDHSIKGTTIVDYLRVRAKDGGEVVFSNKQEGDSSSITATTYVDWKKVVKGIYMGEKYTLTADLTAKPYSSFTTKIVVLDTRYNNSVIKSADGAIGNKTFTSQDITLNAESYANYMKDDVSIDYYTDFKETFTVTGKVEYTDDEHSVWTPDKDGAIATISIDNKESSAPNNKVTKDYEITTSITSYKVPVTTNKKIGEYDFYSWNGPDVQDGKATFSQDTTIIARYKKSDPTTNNVKVQFKYYDRKVAHNIIPEINKEETIVNYAKDYSLTENIDAVVLSAYNDAEIGKITNVIDEYKFWINQKLAVEGIKTQPYYHEMKTTEIDLTDPSSIPKFEGNVANANFDYHTNCYASYGAVAGYTQNEQWVTYYRKDSSGNDYVSDDIHYKKVNGTDLTAADVDLVVVWGFNTLKTYTVNVYYPTDESAVSIVNSSLNAAALADEFDNKSLKKETYMSFYNMRLAGSDKATDDSTPHLVGYGIKAGYFKEDFLGGKMVDHIGDKNFAYWRDSEGQVASTDLEYGYRITKNESIAAVYNSETKQGINVTAVDPDTYVDEKGEKKIRINNVMNIYGYDDYYIYDRNNKDKVHGIKNIAAIYLRFTDDTNPATFSDTEWDTIKDDIKDYLSKAELGTSTALTVSVSGSKKSLVCKYQTTDKGVEDNTFVELTTKNRFQFTLSATATSFTKNGGTYSNLVVFTAANFGDGDHGDGNKWVLSENYIHYKKGEFQLKTNYGL